MAFMTQAALGANLVAGIYGANLDASGYRQAGEIAAAGQRYQGAVNANQILVNAENQARAADAQAQSDEFEANLADQFSERATAEAAEKAHDYRRVLQGKLAGARAERAASGLALEGSPMLVDENTFAQIEFGVSRIVSTGMTESLRFRDQAGLLRDQAERGRATARFAREAGRQGAEYAVRGGDIAAAGSLSTGYAKASSAMSSGWSSALATGAKLGSTMSTRQVNWGV